jgi:N-acetyl-anhydromuramyl-L-alanine amidase AmpD
MARDWFSWIEDDSLRGGADYTLNGGAFDQDDARRALSKLWAESATQIQSQVGKDFYAEHYPTTRYGGQWKKGNPVGVVDHYTAGIDPRGTLLWFSSKPRGQGIGNSSAHAVISREGVIYLVVNPLERVAWHARGANRTSVGIEHVNAGLLLRKTDGKFYYLKTRAYPEDRVADIQEVNPGEHWEPYSVAQIVANIVFKRWLIWAAPEGQMKEDLFVDHQEVEPDRKIDCGLLWPLYEINELVFSEKPIRDMDWLEKTILTKDDVDQFKAEVVKYLA